jgi:hypothetical protein
LPGSATLATIGPELSEETLSLFSISFLAYLASCELLVIDASRWRLEIRLGISGRPLAMYETGEEKSTFAKSFRSVDISLLSLSGALAIGSGHALSMTNR